MKQSWNKKASVWAMAAALSVTYTMVPVSAEEAAQSQVISEVQISADEPPAQEPAGTASQQPSETSVVTSEAAASETVPGNMISETVPESSAAESSESAQESAAVSADISGAESLESSPEAESVEEESTEEESAEEESTEESSTEEETSEAEEETTAEEEEWSEDSITEDTRGLVFSFSEDGQGMAVTGFDGSRSVVEIPETYGGVRVTSISAGAFRDQTGITSVVIPEGVTFIGREAFYGCTALADIQIPQSVENIGAKAFDGTPYDTALTGDVVYINKILYRCQTDAPVVAIAEGTRVIAEEAFANRVNLLAVIVPDGVTYISSNAFYGCSSLSEIDVPYSVRDIVANAFDGTKWYEERKYEVITINDLLYRVPDETAVTVTPETSSAGETAAEAAVQLQKLTEVTVPEGITTICTLAFANTSVESVQLPQSLTKVNYAAFQNCASLQQITLPEGVVSVDGAAFQNCSALAQASLPESLQYLGGLAFAGCSSLSAIVLPETLTRVNSYTFENCAALSSVQLPSGLDSIGSRAFAGCSALTSVLFPEGLQTITTESFADSGLTAVQLPESLTYLGEGAFSGCTKLNAVQLNAGITAIRSRTFRNCTELRQIAIPEGIKYVGTAAFQNAVSLRELTLPQSMLTICDNAFEGSGVGEGLVLPEYVRTIGSRAFAGCVNLTSIIIPYDVRTMGSQVFADGSGPAVTCSFSRTTYMIKLSGGWNTDWADGTASVVFRGGILSEEQLSGFLQEICSLVPDFESAALADGAFYSQLIGNLCAAENSGAQQLSDGWVRVPELTIRCRVLNLTGIWLEGYYPVNTGVETMYYADGYYYAQQSAYAFQPYGYLLTGQNENGYFYFDRYNTETGLVDGSVTLAVVQSDNDNGIAGAAKLSESIGDAHYSNVYESEEIKQLSESIDGLWMDEDGGLYRCSNYERLILTEDENASEVSYRYTCEPVEGYSFLLTLTNLQTEDLQSRYYYVNLDEENGIMELIDSETLEPGKTLQLQDEQW